MTADESGDDRDDEDSLASGFDPDDHLGNPSEDLLEDDEEWWEASEEHDEADSYGDSAEEVWVYGDDLPEQWVDVEIDEGQMMGNRAAAGVALLAATVTVFGLVAGGLLILGALFGGADASDQPRQSCACPSIHQAIADTPWTPPDIVDSTQVDLADGGVRISLRLKSLAAEAHLRALIASLSADGDVAVVESPMGRVERFEFLGDDVEVRAEDQSLQRPPAVEVVVWFDGEGDEVAPDVAAVMETIALSFAAT